MQIGDILQTLGKDVPAQVPGDVPMPRVTDGAVPQAAQAEDPTVLRQAGRDIMTIQAAGRRGVISKEDALAGLQAVQAKYGLSLKQMERLSQSAGKLTQSFPGLAESDQTGESKLSQFMKNNPRVPQLLLAAASSFSRAPASYNMPGRMVEGFRSGQEQRLMREKMKQESDIAKMSLAGKLMEEKEPKYDVIENIETGEQRYIAQGSAIPRGWKTVSKSSTNISMNVDMAPKTKSDLENKIVMGKDRIARLNRIQQLYKPEFSTYAGQIRSSAGGIAAKAGVAVDEKFQRDYATWKMLNDKEVMEWRKYITGVAGGEKEMEKIESIHANISDPPTTYKYKLGEMIRFEDAAVKRAEDFRRRGFSDLPQLELERLYDVYPLEQYGYYEIGEVYEDENGQRKRYMGRENNTDIWEDVN
jgi:hypothetical protein